MRCPDPDAVYIARDEMHLDALLRGEVDGACCDDAHRHPILRIYRLAQDIEELRNYG